jgi:hypothetical protein
MLGSHFFTTTNQKILRLLSKFSDREFYERQIARQLDIAYGSANRSLNQLFAAHSICRRQAGKMFFYSIDTADPSLPELKKLISLWLLEPLVEDLHSISIRIVLYGSCAFGTDNSKSDIDLFIVTTNKPAVADAISGFIFPRGFEGIRIQSVIKSPVELLQAGESEKPYLGEIERGIILWEKSANESGLSTLS